MAFIEEIPEPNKDANSWVNWKNWRNLATITEAALASGAVVKSPTTSAANVIQPTVSAVPLTIRGHASQAVNLLTVQDSALASLFTISATGAVAITGDLTVANITSGNWQGAVIPPQYGGTGWASYTSGDLIYANGATSIQKLGIGSAGHFLKVSGGAPSWSALTSGEVTTALAFTPVNKAGDTMTGALTLSGDPSSALHAATKQYVDAISAGIQPKAAVACATTANITLSGEQTIDGVLTSASRVLVKDQSTGSQNGIYVSAAGAWSRATDMDADSEAPGALVFVSGGNANGSTQWQVSTPAPITVGTTAITWVKTFQAEAYVGGAGLTLSGLTFAVGTASSSRIVVNADDIDLATTGVSASTYTKVTVDVYGRVTAGTTLADGDIPSALTGKTYNGLTLTAQATGFTIAGGTASRTLTVAANANVSGTNTGDQTITLTGDVTGSGTGSFAATIANNAVTLAKMATMATDSFLGRDTAGTGNVEVLSVATVKTLLNLTGTNSGDQTITLTGDVTGSGTGSFATVITASAVTLAKLANLPANTIIGNNTGSSATPLALTASQVRTLLGLATIATSGSASDLSTGTLPAGRFPALTGAVTTSAGSVATSLASDIVGDSNLRNSAALSVIGRSANSTGDPADIAAGTDAHVLRRSGTTLGFGTIGDASITALAASKLTGTSLPSGIVSSSLTSLGTLTSLSVSGISTLTGNVNINGATNATNYGLNVLNKSIATNSGSFYSFGVGDASFTANSEFVQLRHSGTLGELYVSRTTGGAFRPLVFYTSDLESLRIATDGALTARGNASFSGGYVRTTDGLGSNAVNGSASDRGAVIIGVSGGSQLQMDYNDIQAMSNTTPADLFINSYGGNTNLGRPVIPVQDGAPSSPTEGLMYVDTTGSSRLLYVYVEGAWRYTVLI